MVIPEVLPPMDPDEFTTAFNFAMNAVGGKAIVTDPTTMSINLEDEDGSVSQYKFTDNPITRMASAMAERYHGDSGKYYSVLLRTFALTLSKG